MAGSGVAPASLEGAGNDMKRKPKRRVRVEYLSGSRWLLWQIVPSIKAAREAIAKRPNLNACCRIVPPRQPEQGTT